MNQNKQSFFSNLIYRFHKNIKNSKVSILFRGNQMKYYLWLIHITYNYIHIITSILKAPCDEDTYRGPLHTSTPGFRDPVQTRSLPWTPVLPRGLENPFSTVKSRSLPWNPVLSREIPFSPVKYRPLPWNPVLYCEIPFSTVKSRSLLWNPVLYCEIPFSPVKYRSLGP